MNKEDRKVKITIESDNKTIKMEGKCLLGFLLDDEDEDGVSVQGMLLGYDISPIAIGKAIANMTEVLDDLPESATAAYAMEHLRRMSHIGERTKSKQRRDADDIKGMGDLTASFKDWLGDKAEGGAI